jgi:hypothetical protein
MRKHPALAPARSRLRPFRSLASALLLAGAAQAATPDTLFVTWDHDPARSATIQWLAPGTPLPAMPGTDTDSARPITQVPRLGAAIVADGDLSDWPDHAFHVALLATPDGEVPAARDLHAEMRLGWTDTALALAFSFADDHLVPGREAPWDGDSLELFVGAPGGGHVQLSLSRAHDLVRFIDRRPRGAPALELAPARKTTPDGRLHVELLVPLAELGVKPAPDAELRLQVVVNDSDPGRPRAFYAWYPLLGAYENPAAFASLRLGTGPASPPANLRAQLAPLGEGRFAVHVAAPASQDGAEVLVSAGSRTLAKLPLGVATPGDHARARVDLPAPLPGHQWGPISVRWADSPEGAPPVDVVTLPLAARVLPPAPVEFAWWPQGEDASPRATRSAVHAFGPDSGVYVHRVRLTGLAPDTRHHIRVGDSSATESFLTAPARLDGPLVFAEGGDIGTKPVVAELHRQAASWSPRFAVVGGDLAYADGVHHDRWWTYLRTWHAHMRTPEGDIIPKLVCIGNHEVRGGYNGTRAEAPFYYALFDGLYPETGYAALDFGDYLSLLFLDTAHTTPVAGAQTDWLRAALAARREVLHRLLVWHVPAWPSHREFEGRVSRQIREHWLPVVEADPVSIIFEHHDHTYKRTRRMRDGRVDAGGLLFVGDGNWGRGSRPVYPERPYLEVAEARLNVLRVTLRPDGTGDVLAVDEKGAKIDAFSFARP